MDITREDLNYQTKEIKEYIAERVGRVEQRLDQLNGRVYKHDRELGEHHADLETIKQEMFNNTVDVEPEQLEIDPLDRPALTKRDLKFIGSVVAATTVLLEAAHAVWQFFMAVHK
jgi:hypothetical protein